MNYMKPNREAVSLVITDDDNKFLTVKRAVNPNDDLGGVWGLPAVLLKEGESHKDAALRVGRQKLGVDIELGTKIGDSTHERKAYILHLTDYEAKIVKGIPTVPQGQSDQSIIHYAECKFSSDPAILLKAAKKGSQCTQIFLESKGIDWQE